MQNCDESCKIPETGEVINNYQIRKMVDNTKYSFIFVSKNIITHEKVCLKFTKYTKNNCNMVDHEIQIMESLNSPYIIQCKNVFDYPPFKCIVMPLASCDLQMICSKLKGHKLPEQAAKVVMQSALLAVKYLHSKQICHRDIKPDNFLILEKEEDGGIFKLGDLGFAKKFENGELCNEYLGTLLYAAPEIVSGTPYDKSIDIWSLGVSMYLLLSGFPPFPATPECTLRRCIKSGAFMFPTQNWKGVSPEAKDLIRHMICVKPSDRWTPEECLKHIWFDKIEPTVDVFRPIINDIPNIFEHRQNICI